MPGPGSGRRDPINRGGGAPGKVQVDLDFLVNEYGTRCELSIRKIENIFECASFH